MEHFACLNPCWFSENHYFQLKIRRPISKEPVRRNQESEEPGCEERRDIPHCWRTSWASHYSTLHAYCTFLFYSRHCYLSLSLFSVSLFSLSISLTNSPSRLSVFLSGALSLRLSRSLFVFHLLSSILFSPSSALISNYSFTTYLIQYV